MAETHVISALVTKHSELQGSILMYQEMIKEIKENLSVIERSIKIFNPDYDLNEILPKRSYSRHFKHGELSRMTIEYLKDKGEVSAQEIAENTLNTKSLPKNLYQSIYSQTYGVLKNLVEKDIAEIKHKDGIKVYRIKD